MRFSLSRRTSLRAATLISASALGISGIAATAADAKASARASSTTPIVTAVAPAKALDGEVLNVGDQAGTGAEAVLEAAGLIKVSGSSGVLKDGLHVTWDDFTSGPPILEAEEAGAVDIGGVGDAPPIFADPTGKVVIVGVLKSTYDNAALLVPANSPITSVSQLVGKTVAVGTGTSADYHLLTVLEKAGVSPSSVTHDSLSGAAGLAALESGSVAAFDTWSPWVEDAEAQGARVLVTGAPYGSPYSYQVASAEALKNPKKVLAIRDYLTELDKAYVWVKSHPSFWAHTWSTVTSLPFTVTSAATLDDPYTPIPLTSSIVAQEQDVLDGFASAGEIPSKYDIAQYASSAFAGAVTGDWPATTTTKHKKKKS